MHITMLRVVFLDTFFIILNVGGIYSIQKYYICQFKQDSICNRLLIISLFRFVN